LKDIINFIENKLKIKVYQNYSASRLSTIKAGADVKYLILIKSIEEIKSLIKFLNIEKVKYKIIGNGSNIIFPDSSINEIVIKFSREFDSYNVDKDLIKVSSSFSMMKFSRIISGLGFSGFEFAAGIPGLIGGGCIMNAGAHKSNISDVLEKIVICNEFGELEELSANDLNYSYRNSNLGSESIILFSEFKLVKADKNKILKKLENNLYYRKNTQPLQMPSTGSTFMNPKSGFAGDYIERAGLKGYSIGGAQVSELHANWIINPEKKASSQDLKNLIYFVKDRVYEKFQVNLETEVRFW